jgi:hypothetical protein
MALRFHGHNELSPEKALLLTCARRTLQADHVQRLGAAVRQGIDWNLFWSLARAHGVGFFVGTHLLPADAPPSTNGELSLLNEPEFIRRVKHDLWQETAHALVLREHQLRLNAELTRSGIQALWLKGLVLSERLYGRLEARHCGDLDLLVAPSDVPQVEELLTQLGFQRYRSGEAGKEFHPMAAHHSIWCAHVLPDWVLMVELHHQLSGPSSCQPSATDLFLRSQLVRFQGQECRVPSFEDELLILCLHAHHHNYALLRCLMDVGEFVRRYSNQIDWGKLVRQARRARCLGRLLGGLEITDTVLGLKHHREVFSLLPTLKPCQRLALRRLSLASLLDPRSQQDDLLQARFSLLMDSWADSARLLAPRLFPSRAHARSLCPPFLRRASGLPHVYYYLHSANQLLQRARS